MDRTHETFLVDMLRDVRDHGSARVAVGLLYRWYRTDRLTGRVWSDITSRWEDVCKEAGRDPARWRLFRINLESGQLSFVCLEPADTPPDKRTLHAMTEA